MPKISNNVSDVSRRSVIAAFGALPLFAAETDSRPALRDLRQLVPALSDASCSELEKLVSDPGFRGKIPAKVFEQLKLQNGLNTEQFMLDLLPVAQIFSSPPITNYRVGAVLLGQSGSIYLGANIEVPANVLSLSVHAEQSASSNAFMGGEPGIQSLAVTAAPCGHCRQFLNEFVGDRELRVIVKNRPATQLSALLPSAFGPRDLGIDKTPFDFEPYIFSGKTPTDKSAMLAIEAARRSYAPYSKSPAGVAIKTAGGEYYAGSYLENAAFNPSLSPLQVAMAGMAVARDAFANILEVCLVEVVQASITQASSCRATLSALAPKASVRLIRLKTAST